MKEKIEELKKELAKKVESIDKEEILANIKAE